MEQTLTVKIKIQPSKEQEQLLIKSSKEYIKVINELVAEMVEDKKSTGKTSKDVKASLNSAVKNQAIKDAKSIFATKVKKTKYKIIPVLKKPVIVWNNQNYSIGEGFISFPIIVNNKSTRIKIKGLIDDYAKKLLFSKLGTLRITKKSNKWVAQIAVTLQIDEKGNVNNKVMGVDVGLKIPAVAVIEGGKTRFFGNGRENKYNKRKFRSKRKKLGKVKKLNAVEKLNDKEQRWMKDKDHKVSREIVQFAKSNNVSIIRLEKLTNIRNTAKTSRKNEKNLHTWSFYRLAQFIEYKANLEGIKVEYVDPKYTSQKCPICSELNHAKDRKYSCKCGFKGHRDVVGALNIINATVIDGKSLSA